jgi:hypothetical protein
VVLSLNSSSAALRAAERTAPHLAAGSIFADANTATPALKKKLAAKKPAAKKRPAAKKKRVAKKK